MERLLVSNYDLPFSAFDITRVHSKGADLFGLMLPSSSEQPPMLIERNSFGLVVFPLSGPRNFQRIQLGIGAHAEGIWFSDPRIAVDISSRINPQSGGRIGDLSLSYGSLNLLIWDGLTNPPFPEPCPMSISFDTGDANPVGFSRWSIYTVVGEREVELWRRGAPEAETT
ncbi:hypothetical protein [Sphingopyxis sp. PAMC25046]|uniref:hypothetical protein n=1 Tax=Sphingopyxis sp. PAMC25046 TaxID=2565556 RepID=UPI00144637F0|nr:hypothetical protein [Sphingopyxis sp. PAMC25046]